MVGSWRRGKQSDGSLTSSLSLFSFNFLPGWCCKWEGRVETTIFIGWWHRWTRGLEFGFRFIWSIAGHIQIFNTNSKYLLAYTIYKKNKSIPAIPTRVAYSYACPDKSPAHTAIWGGRGWYSKNFVKFWIWVYSPLPVNGLWSYFLKRQGWHIDIDINQSLVDQFWWNFVFILLFALANFQQGRKGQRSKAKFPKTFRSNFYQISKVVHNVFMSIFKLNGPISRNFVLELTVQYWHILI